MNFIFDVSLMKLFKNSSQSQDHSKLLASSRTENNFKNSSQTEQLIHSQTGQLFKNTSQSEQLFKNTNLSEQLFKNTSRLFKTARQLEPMPISYHALRLRPNTVYMYEIVENRIFAVSSPSNTRQNQFMLL